MPRLAATAALLTFLLAAPALGAAPPAENAQRDIGYLNEERAASGLPAGVTENPAWSDGCAKHNEYQRQNGGLTHQEEMGKPGYTPEGAQAGQTSILSQGDTWGPMQNPWEDAPIHLIQLFTPSLAETGIDDAGGYVCTTTFPGMDRAQVATPTVTPYPGDGSTGFPTYETASEGPFVPGDFVGLPQGTTTGRHLFVYLDLPGQTGPANVKLLSSSLTGPDGPVEVRSVDNTTDQIGPYLTGGILIPVEPLKPGSEYTASASVEGPGGPLSKTWKFTTTGDKAPPPDPPNVSKATGERKGKSVKFTVVCASVACAGKAQLTKRGTATKLGSKSIQLAAGASKTLHVALNRKGRKLLKRNGKVKVNLRVTFTSPAGVLVTRKLTLKRP